MGWVGSWAGRECRRLKVCRIWTGELDRDHGGVGRLLWVEGDGVGPGGKEGGWWGLCGVVVKGGFWGGGWVGWYWLPVMEDVVSGMGMARGDDVLG